MKNSKKIPFKIALVEPKIPQNTGNIARLCACTDSELYLIGKLGFHLTDKYLKRSGMDYWEDVKYEHLINLDDLKQKFPDSNFYYLSTKASKYYTNVSYKEGDVLVFGSETKGLSQDILECNKSNLLKIPMTSGKRSLNLSNSVSIVLYEAIRQTNFFE